NPKKNTVSSAEALVRWFHPVHGMVSPGKFIPVFERNGFIVRLDRFVWEEACRLQRKRLDAGKSIVPISVNLSRLNFYSLDLPEFLATLLEKYQLEPWMLKLEVTESAYTDNQLQLLDMISTFRDLGFSILMDDFGSGYSSLNMLKDMPLDTLKVDMAFIRELEKSKRVAIILKFIVELAEELGMSVVVEGVETQVQSDYVASLGEVDIQGYFFSRPLPIPDYEKLLDKYSS
ncbi:MAG: EAL domain-containing protein, partial [Selenomonadaceae bacterium]|nr:EAL domain-containing protein [Selenomonadaceae bacterium]